MPARNSSQSTVVMFVVGPKYPEYISRITAKLDAQITLGVLYAINLNSKKVTRPDVIRLVYD